MFSESYYPNYYSVTDICVTQVKFKCEVEKAAPQLGFLDPDSLTDTLAAGTTIEIPMWLLLDISKQIVSNVKSPEAYSRVFKEICDADAYSVDLSKINKYYYEYGRYVNAIDTSERKKDDGEVDENMLTQTFRQRARILVDLCKNTQTSDLKLDVKFDLNEIGLYKKGCRTTDLLSKWLLSHTHSIETSQVVSNHKKRKRAAIEMEKDRDARN